VRVVLLSNQDGINTCVLIKLLYSELRYTGKTFAGSFPSLATKLSRHRTLGGAEALEKVVSEHCAARTRGFHLQTLVAGASGGLCGDLRDRETQLGVDLSDERLQELREALAIADQGDKSMLLSVLSRCARRLYS
jgi:hypothetical protein